MQDERSDVHVRFDRWVQSTGKRPNEIGTLLGCDSTHISCLRLGRKRAGLGLALSIERASADWSEGPIRADEWVGSKVVKPASRAAS
jgi:hypothetical protein